jgi:hypothetical protein
MRSTHFYVMRARGTSTLLNNALLSAHFRIADHAPEPTEGMTPTMSECQIPQPFRAHSAGNDTCATLHDHLYARGIIWLDRCHKFEIDKM